MAELEDFSDRSFWKKLGAHAKVMGAALVFTALKLYYTLLKPEVPRWAKLTIVGALVYLISPFDAIPDWIPIIGYSDDAGALASAVVLVAAYIDDASVAQAETKMAHWFGADWKSAVNADSPKASSKS